MFRKLTKLYANYKKPPNPVYPRRHKGPYVKLSTEELVALLDQEHKDYTEILKDPKITLLRKEQCEENLERIKILRKMMLSSELNDEPVPKSEIQSNLELVRDDFVSSGDVVGIETEKRNNKFYQSMDILKDEDGWKSNFIYL